MSLKGSGSPVKNSLRKKNKPTETNIFDLNTYCFDEVISYLDFTDAIQVYHTDERFQEYAVRRFSRGGRIGEDFVIKWPEKALDAFLSAHGGQCSKLEFFSLPEQDFLRILAYFPNLRDLDICFLKVTGPVTNPERIFPVALKTLNIDHCELGDSLLDWWMPKLNPTLTRLSMNHDFIEVVSRVIWNHIMEMDQLTHLNIGRADIDIPPGHRQLFPNLVSFTFSSKYINSISLINALACEDSLTELIINDIYKSPFYKVPVSTFKRFKKLRHLNLDAGLWWKGSSLRTFVELTQLESFHLDCGRFDCLSDVYAIAKGMPFLRELSLEDIIIQYTDVPEEKFKARLAKICFGRQTKVYASFCDWD